MAERQRESSLGIADILRDIVSDIQHLIRGEINLARTEIQHNIKSATRGAAVLATGGALALVGVFCLALAAIFLLSVVVDAWLAAVIVGLVLLVIAGIMVWVGLNKMSAATAKPEQTIETLKEDREWLRRMK